MLSNRLPDKLSFMISWPLSANCFKTKWVCKGSVRPEANAIQVALWVWDPAHSSAPSTPCRMWWPCRQSWPRPPCCGSGRRKRSTSGSGSWRPWRGRWRRRWSVTTERWRRSGSSTARTWPHSEKPWSRSHRWAEPIPTLLSSLQSNTKRHFVAAHKLWHNVSTDSLTFNRKSRCWNIFL